MPTDGASFALFRSDFFLPWTPQKAASDVLALRFFFNSWLHPFCEFKRLFVLEFSREFPGLFLLLWPKKKRSSSFVWCAVPNASLQPFPYIQPVQSEKAHFTISSLYRILWRPISVNYVLAGWGYARKWDEFQTKKKCFPNFDCYKPLKGGNRYEALLFGVVCANEVLLQRPKWLPRWTKTSCCDGCCHDRDPLSLFETSTSAGFTDVKRTPLELLTPYCTNEPVSSKIENSFATNPLTSASQEQKVQLDFRPRPRLCFLRFFNKKNTEHPPKKNNEPKVQRF